MVFSTSSPRSEIKSTWLLTASAVNPVLHIFKWVILYTYIQILALDQSIHKHICLLILEHRTVHRGGFVISLRSSNMRSEVSQTQHKKPSPLRLKLLSHRCSSDAMKYHNIILHCWECSAASMCSLGTRDQDGTKDPGTVKWQYYSLHHHFNVS